MGSSGLVGRVVGSMTQSSPAMDCEPAKNGSARRPPIRHWIFPGHNLRAVAGTTIRTSGTPFVHRPYDG
jgi:hypothetical protein